MSQNDVLYHVPQAYIMTEKSSKIEFAGLVSFPADYDNGMMFNTISNKGGLFGGHIGHPPPCKLKVDKIPEYMSLLSQNPNIASLHPKVKEMITSSTPWTLEELKLFISTASSEVSSQTSPSVQHKPVKRVDKALVSPDVRVEKLLDLVKEKEREVEIKTLLAQGKAAEESLQKLLTIVTQNQEDMRDISKKLDDLKLNSDKLVNMKGLHQAFVNYLKAPLSIRLDRFSRELTILGSEKVIESLGVLGGPFGDDLSRLQSDGTVSTISLPTPTPMEILNHFFLRAIPTAAPAAKSVIIIYIEVEEISTRLPPAAIKYKGDSLRSDLGTIHTEALKYYATAIIAIPPASFENLAMMLDLYKHLRELTDVVIIDLSDISKNEVETKTVGDGIAMAGEGNPITGPGWKCTSAAVANVLIKAMKILEPSEDIDYCSSCWGSHFGLECPVSKAIPLQTAMSDDKDKAQHDGEKEVCLRCLGSHVDECRVGDRECSHCGDRGHAFYVHEVVDINLQESIRANIDVGFEFVAKGQATKPFHLKSQSRGVHGGGNRQKRTLASNNQLSKLPKLSAVIRK